MRKKDSFIWYEKYRPKKIEEFIFSGTVKDAVENYIKDGDIEHVIFHGRYGTGKSSLVGFLAEKLEAETLIISASTKEERGIAVVNEKIIPFAQRMSFGNFKIIDLRESEKLTPDAQEALKDVIEEYQEHCRFIFSTNNINKIDGGIRSRCTEIEVKPEDPKEVARRVWDILQQEGIEAKKRDVMEMVNVYFPDIRSCVKMAQFYSRSGTFDISKMVSIKDTETLLELLKKSIGKNHENKMKIWKEMRLIINNIPSNNLDDIYSFLYEKIDSIVPEEKMSHILLIISEYIYRSSQVFEKEIMLSSCVLEIINEL